MNYIRCSHLLLLVRNVIHIYLPYVVMRLKHCVADFEDSTPWERNDFENKCKLKI